MKVKAAADVFNVMFLSIFKKMFLYEPCIVCDICLNVVSQPLPMGYMVKAQAGQRIFSPRLNRSA